MRVEVIYRTDPLRPLTDPLPERNGVVFRLVRGDVLDPWLDPDGWFGPRKPWFVLRFRSRIPLPFFAWRLGWWSGYIGAKVYGVDSPTYATWAGTAEVYDGSQAICFSVRPFARSE